MHEASISIMALAFFGVVAVTVRSLTSIWMRRMEIRREVLPVAGLAQQLERIESAVEVMAVEIERISEAQRFSARLLSEREPGRFPPSAMTPETRVVTPH